jgi:ubiquinone/menaquinone biosynthesis C-methylase UbiE
VDLEHIRETYDTRAAGYDRTIGAGERVALGHMRARFGAALRGDTLEIAIGSGLNLPFYTNAVTSAAGIDLSRGMLEQAQRKAVVLKRSIQLLQMDAQHLAFATGSFDTVAISLALCTVPDPAAALREMARVCRPSGRIVLLEHVLSPHRPIALLERLLSPIQERRLGCHLDRTTLDLAIDLGFSIESEERRLAGVIRLAVARPPAL